jgi:hypothetical protein
MFFSNVVERREGERGEGEMVLTVDQRRCRRLDDGCGLVWRRDGVCGLRRR